MFGITPLPHVFVIINTKIYQSTAWSTKVFRKSNQYRKCKRMECPICFEQVPKIIAVVPCGHMFCQTCLTHLTGRTTCSMCRTTLVSAPVKQRRINTPSRTKEYVILTSRGPAGVTFNGNFNPPMSYVTIKRVEAQDEAQKAGLRASDTVVTMNGIFCLSHAHAAEILTTAHAHKIDVSCEVQTKRAFARKRF